MHKSLSTLFLLLASLLFGACVNRAEPEMHMIPKCHQGYVILIFDDPNGSDEKYEDGFRVYEIPSSGILRTKFSQQEGWIANGKLKYYYVDGKNKIELKELPTDNTVIGSRKVYIQNKELSIGAIRYLVCTQDEQEKYFEEMHRKIDELFPPVVQ